MITRETIKKVLEDYLSGHISTEEVSQWAYEMIADNVGTSDELVTEVLYNLVSYHDVGLIFDVYRPSREKLEYLMHWLDGDQDCDWNLYTSIFDPSKLS